MASDDWDRIEREAADLRRAGGDGEGWQSAWRNIDANDLEAQEGLDAVRSAFDGRKQPAPPSLLPLIDMSGWNAAPPERYFAWGTWIPLRQTTMLTGAGGVGKSLLQQMMLTCMALCLPFLGMETRQGNVLYLTAEDDADELWRRQRAICDMLGVSVEALVGKMHIVSLAGEPNAALAELDERGRLVATDLWRQVQATAEAMNLRYLAFDTATDMMGGDHNDVHQVAAFVNLLTGLAIERDGAAIILHHPNKAGEDWLGSVAWHNKVRSRLIIKRSGDGDPDGRTIENPKANYGPSNGKIDFRWHAGAFIRDDELPEDTRAELDRTIAANGENAAFLCCLRARAEQGEGRQVGPSSGANYAPAQFEGMPEAKGYKRDALKRAMDRLYAIGSIESKSYRNTAKGRNVTVIVEAS